MRVAIASFAAMPPEFTDDRRIIEALAERGVGAESISWDDPDAEWGAFGAVVIRSTWDYDQRRDEFVRWCDSVGPTLHNSAAIVRWNSDKHYLADLASAGVPVVATEFVAPGDPAPALAGELVVKPSVSAGGRDSGRFGPAAHDLARELIETIHASGRVAMVQPYQRTVDSIGETAVLCIDGEPAHTLRKAAVLGPDEVAPVRDGPFGAAEVMYDPGLVTAGEAAADELELARDLIAEVSRRFDYLPLYARVDMIRDPRGSPILLELEAIEPNFYLDQVPATTAVVAEAIIGRLPES
ncbi:MAG: RimK family alpha-L-glutamate ligase [Vicinamibacteria bacterium]